MTFQRILVLIRDFVLAILAVGVAFPLWFLPWNAAARLGRLYGLVLWAVWPLARRTGLINLRRAYGPSMLRDAARRRVRAVCANLGQSIAEGVQFARRFSYPESHWEGLYVAEDRDLETRILADPRPKIFVTGHLGSWEAGLMIAGHRVAGNGAAVARHVDNVFLDAIVRRVRFAGGADWIDKRGASEDARSRLERGQSVAMLLDETGGRKGPWVEFFGRPASTRRTAALLSLLTGCPVVLGAAVRRGDPGSPEVRFLYRLALFEPPEWSDQPDADAATRMTAAITARFEQWVREDPDQWRWIHWRWKHRPDGSRETYSRADVELTFR